MGAMPSGWLHERHRAHGALLRIPGGLRVVNRPGESLQRRRVRQGFFQRRRRCIQAQGADESAAGLQLVKHVPGAFEVGGMQCR